MRTGRQALGSAIYSFAVIALVSYFTYAAIQGNQGLIALIEIEAQEADLLAERDRLRQERQAMEVKTHRLSDQHLDLDLLDEQARRMLGLIRADEVLIR
ncbi:MAG: septum formation initiator family protein [Pseudomonadota bacterium]